MEVVSVPAQEQEQERINIVNTFKQLHSGDLIDLQFRHQLSPIRLKGKIIGYEEGQFIIIRMPQTTLRDYPDIVDEGQPCVVRTVVEGSMGQCIAFHSAILQVLNRPKGILFLKYPKEVQRISLRKESRVDTYLPVRIIHRHESDAGSRFGEKTELSGMIRDISKNGCRAYIQHPASQANVPLIPVFIKAALKGETDIELKAEIKNQQRIDADTVALGMQFEQNEPLLEFISFLGIA